MWLFIIIIAIVLYYVYKGHQEREEQERQRRVLEQRLAQQRAELLASENRKQKVIESAKLYPHAFYALIKQLDIQDIPSIRVTLPGTSKSNWSKKKESSNNISKQETNKQQGCLVSRNSSSILRFSHIQTTLPKINTRRFILDDNPVIREFTLKNRIGRSIDSLSSDEYERIYKFLGDLQKQEKRIKEELREEDIRIKFEDQILDNKKRSKYYTKFLASQSGVTDRKEYCILNLSLLDRFISSISNSEYKRIRQLYPEATDYFENLGIPSKESKEEYISANEDRIIEIDKVIEEYNKLKKKYPFGLPAFEKEYAWSVGGKIIDLTIEQIIEYEDKIAQCEKRASEEFFYKHWQKTQKDFSTNCLNAKNNTLTGWGGYSYKVPLVPTLVYKDNSDTDFTLWQFFYKSYSEDETVDTSYYPEKSENRRIIPKLLNKTTRYPQSVYSKLIRFIEELKKVYGNENKLVVLFSCSSMGNSQSLINYHFSSLFNELDTLNIPYFPIGEVSNRQTAQAKYIVIDLITTNDSLRNNTKHLHACKRIYKSQSPEYNDSDRYSDVVYISILKGLDRDEMLALNKKIDDEKEKEEQRKRKEAELKKKQEEEARKRREQEEEARKRREQEEARRKAELAKYKSDKDAIIKVLQNNGIQCFYHFTARENLSSIRQLGGLFSWYSMEQRGKGIPCPGGGNLSRQLDQSRGLEDYVRLSFTKNHPMMYVAKNEGRIANPVVLEISIDVATLKGTKYSNKNATIRREPVNIGETISDLRQIHFQTVRQINHFNLDDEEKSFYQAEVLVKTFIPIDYIMNLDNPIIP